MTFDEIAKMIEDAPPPPPDPFNGATTLMLSSDTFRALAPALDLYAKNPLIRPTVEIAIRPILPSGHGIGFRPWREGRRSRDEVVRACGRLAAGAAQVELTKEVLILDFDPNKLLPVPAVAGDVAAEAQIAERAHAYIRASRAASTLASYERHFKVFARWCIRHGRSPIPAGQDTLVLFLTDMAERYRPSSLNAIISAIAFAHRDQGHSFDRSGVDTLLAGIRRTHGTAERRMDAIMTEELCGIVDALPSTLAGARDRALLLVGFAGAMRRSELVGLDIGQRSSGALGLVELEHAGARIILDRGKTDQEGHGFTKGLLRGTSPCPVAALEHWLGLAGITTGPIFRPITKEDRIGSSRLTDRSVADIIKRSVRRGVMARGGSQAEAYARARRVAGHSLRAGFTTSAVAADVTDANITRHVGWSSPQMIGRYTREVDLFRNNPLREVLKAADER